MIASRRPAVALAALFAAGLLAAGAVLVVQPFAPAGLADAVDAPGNGSPIAGGTGQATAGSASGAGLFAGQSSAPAGPAFDPIDVFSAAANPASPFASPSARGSGFFQPDTARPNTPQSIEWLRLKAAGRLALSHGGVLTLGPGADPLAGVPAARKLDTAWTAAIVEPPGVGVDEKGTSYDDRSYWNLCGPGAAAVALYYWQRAAGRPDVTGTAGWFLDPYAASGVEWPSSGPRFVDRSGVPQTLGTYWSGSDTVSGYPAHGRGYLMYLAMIAQPPTWSAPGLDTFALNDAPLYPVRGSSRDGIRTVLNWEASGHDESAWAETWYASVGKADAALARDVAAAVMLDVGRDGVPVVAAVDTFELPNWQLSPASSTPHIRHAVAIVGYDNTANPPTFSYIDTCGRGCNGSPANTNGGVHVITQAAMVQAILDRSGSGFVW